MTRGRKKNSEKTLESVAVWAAINFPWALSAIAAWNDHLAPVAQMFSHAPWLEKVRSKVVKKVYNPDGWDVGIDGFGYTHVSKRNWVMRPTMQVRHDSTTNAETLTHELIHYYTLPDLYAADQHLRGYVRITDNAIKDRAVWFYNKVCDLYEKTKTLYKEKTGEEYSAYNGSSIKDNVTEFMANITHAWSVQQLKQAWVYDEFMATVQDHISTVRSVDIPYEDLQKAA